MYALGVDLGTVYTAAATWRDGHAEIVSLGSRAAIIPSVVLLREDASFLTGEAANRRAMIEPGRVAREFKRRFGDSTPIMLGGTPHSPEALMGRLLRSVVAEVTTQQGEPPVTLCVCHPANWGPYKTDLLQQAIRMADLSMPVTLSVEPVAAAAYYARQQRVDDGALVAVYDLGGGTFDSAVVRKNGDGFEIIGRPEGIEHLGGADFDAAVFEHVRSIVGEPLTGLDDALPATVAAVSRLREECTSAKETLSSDTDTTIPVLLPGHSTEVRITRGELERMVRPALYDTISALQRAIRSAGVTPAELHSVLLIGGSSRMPLVAQLVGAEVDRPVAVDAHPKHAVALGAAIIASTHAARALAAAAPATSPTPAPAPAPARATDDAATRRTPAPGSAAPGASTAGALAAGALAGSALGAATAGGHGGPPPARPGSAVPAPANPGTTGPGTTGRGATGPGGAGASDAGGRGELLAAGLPAAGWPPPQPFVPGPPPPPPGAAGAGGNGGGTRPSGGPDAAGPTAVPPGAWHDAGRPPVGPPPPPPQRSGGRPSWLLALAAGVVVLLVVGPLAWYIGQHVGSKNAAGAAASPSATPRTTGTAARTSGSTSPSASTKPPANLIYTCPTNADAKVWACLKSAKASGGKLFITYTTNFTLSAVQDAAHYHFHLYLANPGLNGATDPVDAIMQHVENPGSWFIIYDGGVTTIDNKTTERGGKKAPLDVSTYQLLCVRVASGLHGLVNDTKGGLRSGNCVRMTS